MAADNQVSASTYAAVVADLNDAKAEIKLLEQEVAAAYAAAKQFGISHILTASAACVVFGFICGKLF